MNDSNFNPKNYFARGPLKPTPYAKYQNFATSLSRDMRTNPTDWSIQDNIDTAFRIGSTYQFYGPQSDSSQAYMAEKCSKRWDNSCEFLSNDRTFIKSNTGKIHSKGFHCICQGETIGDALVENSAERAFCDLSHCMQYTENFNPLDNTSAMIKTYVCNEDVVCRPPKNPDDSILLNKVLDRPDMHLDLLLNMYRNSRHHREQYKDTRIGELFKIIDIYFSNRK